MNRSSQNSIPAFTIFEVTIVLAIMGVVISMVAFSVQRLFNQMQVSEEIHAELNNFYKVRSMLWHDCITADSIKFQEKQFLAYSDGEPVQYRVEDDMLYRNQLGTDQPLNLGVLNFGQEEVEDGTEISIIFDWKGGPMEWRFFNRPDVADEINNFFERRDG